jgi:hypothetical protein
MLIEGPTTICYALNVKGPGIMPDPRLPCADPSKGMGAFAGFVSASESEMQLMVPAGPDRVVQLIGIESTVGCPDLNTILDLGVQNGINGMGEPYEIGTVTTDIFDDTAVTIVANFESSTKAFGCGGGGSSSNSSSMELRMDVIGNTPNIQVNHCSKIGVIGNASINSSLPAVKPEIVYDPTNSVVLYSDSACANPLGSTGYKNFMNGGNYIDFYVRASGSLGASFDLKVATTATGWNQPVQTFTIANERLEVISGSVAQPSVTPTPSAMVVGTCYPYTISNYKPSGTASLGTVEIKVRNNSDYINPSTVKIFDTLSNCTGNTSAFTPSSSVNGLTTYTTPNLTPISVTYYFKNTVPEESSISIVKPGAEPVSQYMNFLPFNVSITNFNLLRGPIGGNYNLMVSFESGFAGVTAIYIGSQECVITTSSTPLKYCTVPAVSSTGSRQISVDWTDGVKTGNYRIPYFFNYENQPTILSPTQPYFLTSNVSFTGSYYLFTPNLSAVYLMLKPNLSNGFQFTSCSVSQPFPSGMSLNSTNCNILVNSTGAPTDYGTFNITGSIQNFSPINMSVHIQVGP